MLIAYMGETFGANNEVKEQIKIKDHLSFIMDNWYLKEVSLGNIKNIKYIIAAIPVSDSSEDEDNLAVVQNDLEAMKLQIKKLAIEQTKRAISQDEMLKMILYNQDKMMHKLLQNPN